MIINRTSKHRSSSMRIVLGVAGLLITSTAAADSASGTLTYQSKSGPLVVNVASVYLVQTRDAVSGKMIRKLVFSATEISGKLKSCATMICPESQIGEGMTVELDSGSRLNYWFAGNGQRVQYSGSAQRDALALSTDSPQRVAGKFAVDDSASGGVKANVTFDATLFKQ